MRKAIGWGALAVVLCLCGARFCWLAADFPNGTVWDADQAKYTDEGWWASAAVNRQLLGHWNVPGDYNPAAALPVWPLLLVGLFKLTGVSILAARALNVALSIATLALVFLLVRRYSRGNMAATLSVLLLAASPLAFVFSRLAILDSFVAFQFCLLLLVASYAAERSWGAVASLLFLVPVFALTKTTALVLLPAVAWLAWCGMRGGWKVKALLLVAAVCALALKAYAALVAGRGFGEDYRYFFSVNASDDMAWGQALRTAAALVRNGRMIDRVLYPLGLLLLLVAIVWLRRLWTNPLFTACWIAFGCQAIFIFSRQDNFAPRYFLVMLAPLTIAITLAADELRAGDGHWNRRTYWASLAALALALAVDLATVQHLLRWRTFQFYDAAMSIARTVRGDARQNPLLLGVSGSELSLMTGIPSIGDAYGTQDLRPKVLRYQPGWLVVWNSVSPEDQAALAGFALQEAARYPVFDDPDRNVLVLYRMTRRPDANLGTH
jgi:4-amino-4-deoxy-L-arabinose transferase-like glycosyltransferase